MNNYLKLCAVVLLLVPLVGCAKKPPSCASDEALEEIRSQVTSVANFPPEMTFSAQQAANADVMIEARNNKWVAFVKNVKFTLERVTSTGYREQSKSYYCQAELKMQIDTVVQSRSIEYLIQAVESKDRAFELTLEDRYAKYMASVTLRNLSDAYDANMAAKKKQAFMSDPNNFILSLVDVSKLVNKAPIEILSIPKFKKVASTFWDDHPNYVAEALAKPLAPIGETEHYYVGLSCDIQRCENKVLWGVRKDTGKLWLSIMVGQGSMRAPTVESTGLEIINGTVQIPAEVYDWIRDQNSVNQTQAKNNLPMPMSVGEIKQKVMDIDSRFKVSCNKPEYAFYREHSACSPKDISDKNMSDQSAPSSGEIELLKQYKQETDELLKERSKLMHSVIVNKSDIQWLDYLDTLKTKNDANFIRLISGEIGWGPYNQTRKSNADIAQNKYNEIYSSTK